MSHDNKFNDVFADASIAQTENHLFKVDSLVRDQVPVIQYNHRNGYDMMIKTPEGREIRITREQAIKFFRLSEPVPKDEVDTLDRSNMTHALRVQLSQELMIKSSAYMDLGNKIESIIEHLDANYILIKR